VSIYFIADDFGGNVKIGLAFDIYKRRIQLQTGNPRPLKLMGFIKTENKKDDHKIEKALHKKYQDSHISGEWFSISPNQVLDEISKYPYTGFVAKDDNALKFLGRDRDGVPEIGEVWAWQDLDWTECCPYCGCICGLVFSENILLYECLNCGYHLRDDGE
jgi:hypothetical protein